MLCYSKKDIQPLVCPFTERTLLICLGPMRTNIDMIVAAKTKAVLGGGGEMEADE